MAMTGAPIDFSSLPRANVTDDGGRVLDALICTTADVAAAVQAAVAQGYAVMPAGSLTSAINSFDYDRAKTLTRFRDVVAIRPQGAVAPERVGLDHPIERFRSQQIAIDRAHGTVTVGAGLTFEQVNAVLAREVAPNVRVLVDLTSVGSASTGGVIATGGMGPLRIRPSATIEAVCLAEGNGPRVLGKADIAAVQGMQGWTGMVTAARLRYFEVPPQEFGLVLPVQSSDIDGMADFLAYLHPWTRIDLPEQGNRLAGPPDTGNTILNGVELVGSDALEQFAAQADEPARSKALSLLQSCDYAGADMLACLTGWSDLPVEDVLGVLLDPETETIGGVIIDFGVGFSSGTEMDTFRAIREGAPDLARTQARVAPPGRLKPWSTSTDVNIALPRDAAAIAGVLTAYQEYRRAIDDVRSRMAGRVDIHLSAYGHLSPHGFDPHHRVTVLADVGEEASLAEARQAVGECKKALIRELVEVSERLGAIVTGGEKGVPSLLEIARSAGHNRMPPNLREDFTRARAYVAGAPEHFSFRAPGELLL